MPYFRLVKRISFPFSILGDIPFIVILTTRRLEITLIARISFYLTVSLWRVESQRLYIYIYIYNLFQKWNTITIRLTVSCRWSPCVQAYNTPKFKILNYTHFLSHVIITLVKYSATWNSQTENYNLIFTFTEHLATKSDRLLSKRFEFGKLITLYCTSNFKYRFVGTSQKAYSFKDWLLFNTNDFS